MIIRTFFLLALSIAVTLCPPTVSRSAVAPAPATETANAPKRFTFADVNRRAEILATKPFEDSAGALPEFLRTLTYDQYRDIRFRSERSLWRDEGLPFEVQFFHPGFIFLKQVVINVIDNGEAKPVSYSRDLFDYGKNEFPKELPADLGFAGFRLLYPLNSDNRYDEVVVFLGASYFRAIGQNQVYGISARGLAIDTGLPKTEEFPFFREFWIEKPDKDATEITVYALLDSKSATGAYRFVIKPGLETLMDVKAQVYMRDKVDKLGIAPLTSMFFHGENTSRFMDDYRPEVHDSDGLMIARGSGEWIWRPLDNPTKLRISAFQDSNPRGFGLFQRDRDFDHYQDLEALYQKRPSAWVEPIGDWGKGEIQLIEIPTDSERHDNVVAFWVPEKPTKPDQQMTFDYRLYFALDLTGRPPGGKTLATREGGAGTDQLDSSMRKFVIDFGGGALKKLEPDAPVEGLVSVSNGKLVNKVAQKNEFTGGWRLFFELDPEDAQAIDLRGFLKSGEDVLTETWIYRWNHE